MSGADPQVAFAFAFAMRACRAAHEAGPERAIWAALDALESVADVDQLRAIAAVLAANSTELMPPAGVRGAPLLGALDYISAEVTWRASA